MIRRLLDRFRRPEPARVACCDVFECLTPARYHALLDGEVVDLCRSHWETLEDRVTDTGDIV